MQTPRHGTQRRDMLSSLELAEALFDGTDESVLLVTEGGQASPVRGSCSLDALTGYGFEELEADPAQVIREADRERVLTAFRRVAGSPGHRASVSFWIHHREGHLVQLRATVVNRLHDQVLGSILIRLREVEAPRSGRPPAPTTSRSTRPPDSADPQRSGLVTREAFHEAMQLAIARKEQRIWSGRRHARSVLKDRRFDYTLVLVDLDRFKLLLSGFGHQVADSVLAQVSDRIADVLRGRDVFAHLGGGEFGILLDAVGDGHQASRICDRIANAFDDRFDVAGHKVSVSPIMGLATSERRYEKADELMRDAAAAASHAGSRRGAKRRRAAFRSQMRREDKHLMDMIVALNEGVDLGANGPFRTYYQPIISLPTSRVVGFEALARWTHPTFGAVSPADFIPIAEEAGLMVELGRVVMRQACDQVAAWNAAHINREPLSISVNVAGSQLADPHFLDDIEKSLRDSGLAPDRLCLEITETTVLDNIEIAVGAIARLRLYGVRVSLDDFGTGYSSLSYLHQLNYDGIKIDRSFLADGGMKNRIIIGAILGLARNLDVEVVAEGIETVEQASALRELGCSYGQGFLYSPALPAAEVEAWMTAHGAAHRNVSSSRLK